MTADPSSIAAPPAVPQLHQNMMAPAAEPPFLAELESVWGRPWGAYDEVGPLQRVLVRRPGDELGRIDAAAWDERAQALVDPDGMWYWTDRAAPDLELVAAQHADSSPRWSARGSRSSSPTQWVITSSSRSTFVIL